MRIAYIGLGANLPSPAGSPQATLAAAVARIASLGRMVARSSLYSTAPVGLEDQPRFLNAVVALETALKPRELLAALLAIEHEFGRDRSAGIANGPRTLDLDILLFDDLVVSEPDLKIPHPRLQERAFVLVPLNEIAPQARDPRSCVCVSQLVEGLSHQSQGEDHGPQGEVTGVVQVESDGWHAGLYDPTASPDDPARPGADPHRHHH
jgi:2-amino-4-hydroxy-6-hydroxymethyldihydropteridine diphosphokinase